MEIFYVKSKKTGGHYAFKTAKSRKPFENPLNYYAKLKLHSNDVVADIGAYICEYALYAIKQGVSKVKCYEPTPNSFKLMQKNKKDGIELYQMAVVGGGEISSKLYLSNGIGVTNSITKTDRKNGWIEVNTIKYEDAVRDCSVVKIDVEGAEYSYNIVQPQLRAIIVEFHPLVGKDWKQMAKQIIDKIEVSGFKRVFYPTFKCGWDLTGCWER